MTYEIESIRRFRVHTWHLDRNHARLVEEASFEAAAVAYLESVDLATPSADDHEIQVFVQDIRTGHEHCFRVDLDSGETEPCG